MSCINRFQFIGNLTRDTEVGYTGGGQAKAIFDLAVTDKWRDASGQKQEKTNYFRIKSFDAIAENAGKYLGKGSEVVVEGRIAATKWEKNGETVYGNDFIAESVHYLNTKRPANNAE